MSASWAFTCTKREYVGRAMGYHRLTILCLEVAFGRIKGGFLYDARFRVAVLYNTIRVALFLCLGIKHGKRKLGQQKTILLTKSH